MANLLPGWKLGRGEFVLISPEGEAVDYNRYKDITGFCETCGHAVKGHPLCEGCGACCGEGHLEYSASLYRGHDLCEDCIAAWEILNRALKRKAPWREFVCPMPSRFPG